jgi:dihydrofolate synthase/folylpolyglutamate synthase
MKLEKFLEEKPLYYKEIDYERFPKIYEQVKNYFQLPKIVHIVGTNAKGSTGRALAYMLYKQGVKVGHYSSPHVLKFNERIWYNNKNIADETLEQYHQKLLLLLTQEQREKLSYFEYTTLLAMLVFCDTCEYVILEAGLGGEHDATNVFDKVLSLITPIGYDHIAFLGSHIKQIATTKINSVRTNFIVAKQYEKEVYTVALKRAKELGVDCFFAQSYLDEDFYESLEEYLKSHAYPSFFYDNFSTAFCGLYLLGFPLHVDLLDGFEILGRCQRIASNVTIDVGHNVMAAKALLKHFSQRKVNLVYNSYNDKEYKKILSILSPIIKKVEILPIRNIRALDEELLIQTLKELGLEYTFFKQIDDYEDYLVFGSFSVLEEFLKGYTKIE